MIDFIVKYWVEVVFTLICSGIAFLVRHHVKLAIEAKKRHEKDMIDTINTKFDEQKTGMQQQMSECYDNLIKVVKESEEHSMEEDKKIHKEIDIIKDGMLSVEGRAFRNECRKLLEEDHIISFDEYTAILAEHTTYNKLGGNHEGDRLFLLVEKKYQNSVHINKEGDQ